MLPGMPIINSGSSRRRYVYASIFIAAALLIAGSLYFSFSPGVEYSSDPDVESHVLSSEDMERARDDFSEYEGDEVNDIIATADGALLVLRDRLVSVGGPDWREMWSYERRGEVRQVFVSPSGKRIHVLFGDVMLPWGGVSVVGLRSSNGDSLYEHSADSLMGGEQDGDYYFSDEYFMRISVEGEDMSMESYELDSGELSWEGNVSSLCATGRFDSSVGLDVMPAPVGFIASLNCLADDGGVRQLLVHLEEERGGEYWREEWDAEESENIDMFYLSGATVPGTTDDLLGQALASRNGDIEYAFVADGARMAAGADYVVPSVFDYQPLREVFPVPLEDDEVRPDLVVFGMPAEIELQVAVQGAWQLVQDPEAGVEIEDFSILEFRDQGESVRATSYRNWEEQSSPSAVRTLINEMLLSLSEE